MTTQEYIQTAIRIEWKLVKLYKHEQYDIAIEPSIDQTREFYRQLVDKSGLSSDEIKRLIIDEKLTHHQVFDWLGINCEKETA